MVINVSGSIVQNAEVLENEILSGTRLNSSLSPEQKLQMKYCQSREICRDVVGRIFFLDNA